MSKGLIILILSTQSKAYDGFKDSIRKTWMKDALAEGIPCYFYEGGWLKSELVGDTIRLKADDSLSGTFDKFMSCLHFLKERHVEYNVIFRTNLSSYIDVRSLCKFLDNKGLGADAYEGVVGEAYLVREKIYANKIFRPLARLSLFDEKGEKIRFVSGAGLILGRNSAILLMSYCGYKNSINLIEDVKIGWILYENISPTVSVDRLDIMSCGSHKLSPLDYDRLVDGGLFHYKFKNKDRGYDMKNLENMGSAKVRRSICTVSYD